MKPYTLATRKDWNKESHEITSEGELKLFARKAIKKLVQENFFFENDT